MEVTHDERPAVPGSADLLAALEEAQGRAEQLQEALESRVVIEQAKGVLRERFGWTLDDAFAILRYAARSSHLRIHELAEQVVHGDETPNAIVVALARSARWRAAHMRERAEALRAGMEQLAVRIRGQQERLAWERLERAERERPHASRPPLSRSGEGQSIVVVAPSAQAAHDLVQRATLDFSAAAAPRDDGRCDVYFGEPRMLEWAGESHELFRRSLDLIQAWVDAIGSSVELSVGARQFSMRPR